MSSFAYPGWDDDSDLVSDEDRTTQTFGFWPTLCTRALELLSEFHDRGERLFRARKLEFRPSSKRVFPGHTHPCCARLRGDASRFMDEVASTLGERRYDISKSSREEARGIAGARLTRTPKDLLSDAKYDALYKSDLITMVDTDFHLTADQLNSYIGHDIAMYTLQPGSLCGRGPESSWRFISPTVVREDVKGGASYMHSVWDWGKDMVVLTKGWTTVVYDPVTYPVGPGRAVVLLLKARTIRLPLWLLNCLVPGIEACRVSRMSVEEHGKYLVGVFGDPGKRRVELMDSSLPDGEVVSVRPSTWSALTIMSRAVNPDSKKPELRASDVERYCNNAKDVVAPAGCYLISDYFSTSHRVLKPICYQSIGELKLEAGEVNGYVIADGPVPPAVVAVNSENNNDRALKERVIAVANTSVFPADIIGYAAEFVELVVPESRLGKTTPLSTEDVAQRQNAPTQVNRRNRDRGHLALKTESEQLPIQAFMKHEAGASVSDPRSINQVPVDQTTRLSRFTLAAADYLKAKAGRWYAPGKSPSEMGKSIQNLVLKQGKLAGGDYSRMDGRTSVAYREHVYEPFLKRLFPKAYEDEITELLVRERSAKIRMRKGKARAVTTGSNLSGSPATTQLNTINSAFNEYAARRRAGETPRKAYDSLGLYFGDDSVFELAMAQGVVAIANELGMKMTLEEEPEGSPPGRVVFLSRVYPDASTCVHSYPVLVRCLRKLQVTTNDFGKTEKGRSIMRVLKGAASQMVNGHVPIVGPYSRLLEGSGPAVSEGDKAKALNVDRELRWQFSQRKAAATTTLSGAELDLFITSIARDLGIPPDEVRKLDERLRAATTLAELSSIKLAGWETTLPDWAVWVA